MKTIKKIKNKIFLFINLMVILSLYGCLPSSPSKINESNPNQNPSFSKFKNKEFFPNDFAKNQVLSILKDEDLLWTGTTDGIYVYDSKTLKESSNFSLPLLKGHKVIKIIKSLDQSIFAISEQKGLYHLPPEATSFYHTGSSKMRDAIVKKGTNIIYCATSHGIDVWQNQTWRNIKVIQSLREFQSKANYLTSIAQDSSGSFWLGTEFGVFQMKGSKFSFFFGDYQIIQGSSLINKKGNSPLGGNLFYNISTTEDGQVFFSTNGGVNILQDCKSPNSNSNWKLYDTDHTKSRMSADGIEEFSVRGNSPLPSNFISIVKKLDNDLLVGTKEGLGIFSNGKWEIQNLEKNLSGDRIFDIFVDKQENPTTAYIATNGGLTILKQTKKENGE